MSNIEQIKSNRNIWIEITSGLTQSCFSSTIKHTFVFCLVNKDMHMDMNRAFFLKKEQQKPRWKVVDARGQVLGRLATRVADMLHGKHVPTYTPHSDAGDYVIIINANEMILSGNKFTHKEYHTYSGWMGGLKTKKAHELGYPRLFELAVERMLPKSKMGRAIIKKLRIYEGAEHPHTAQMNTVGNKVD